MTRRILSAWLPGWPIRRLQREGWPADQPLAAVETVQGQRRITEACAQATALGVMPGQPLAQARAVCPQLTLAEADPAADRAALDRLALWCTRVSPLTAADPQDGLWIDLTGCAHLFGGEQALAEALAKRLAPVRLAIAGTPGAAWALARAATRPAIQVLPPGAEVRSLAPLPVALLRLDPRVIAGLRRVGLRSIGELARQPRADIAARFGATPGQRLEQAHGQAPEAIAWPRLAAPWSERTGFVEPIGTAEALAHALAALADRLCARLEAAGLGALRVCAVFHRVDDLRPELAIATARPLRDPARMARLLSARLESIDPGFGVETMVLTAEAVGSLTLQQDSMGTRTPQSEDLVATIDDLANRLTPEQLWRPAPRASHVPERATTAIPPLSRPLLWPHPPGERPVRLLRPPEPIEATAPVPDDPPLQFRWRGALHRVRAASGPERIGAEWWRRSVIDHYGFGHFVQTHKNERQNKGRERDDVSIQHHHALDTRFRDYYRVEDQAGARFWLFRTGLPGDPTPPDWFMHGLFG